MAIVVNDTTPRNQYTASGGQTQFTYSFEIFEVTDIKVFKGSTLLTFASSPSDATQYSVQNAGVSGGGTITLGGGATASDVYTLVRDIPVKRTTDFPTSGPFVIDSLNTDLDKMVAMMGEREDEIARSIQLSDEDSSATLTLPLKASRANNILTFDSSGNVSASIAATDVATVAGISANVTTVAGISSNITTVAGKASLITSDFVADLNTLATTDIIADINLLATSDVVADLNTLATTDIVSDLNTLATTDIVSDLNTLATSDIVSDINTLATSDIVSDLNTLATSDFVSDLNTMATSTNVTNLDTVASANSNITAVAGAITNINTVATNVASVNSFAEKYRIASSDPSSSLDTGDLYYNTSEDALKVYNGSAWVTATSGSVLTSLASDTTPELGGDLDVLAKDIVSSSNRDIDLAPHGTGKVVVKGNTNPGTIVFNCESNSHGQTVKSQPHSASVTNTLTLPPGSDQEIVGTTATQTLTNKSIVATQLTGTIANARLDAQLQDVAGLAVTNGNFIVGDGANFVAESGATARASLGLTIGSDVQAFDSDTAKTDAIQSFTKPQRNALTTDNDGSFDMDANNNFKCTPSGNFALTFTNHADGQSGYILLINSGGHTVSLHANTKADANLATTVSTAGTYLISYLSDGTNAYLTNSAIFA